jgi:DNA repair protein RecO (recombination protein O)
VIRWRDQGVLLSVRRHGENSTIIEVFTAEHGRHAGIVRGGASRKIAPVLQPGAQVDVAWQARLDDHLGTYSVELARSRAAAALQGRLPLAGLNAMTALLSFALPEREAQPRLYALTENVLDLLDRDDVWPLAYLRWELLLLEELGYGLDLSQCAVTGTTTDLVFVSPKSGRAVSRAGAGEWADKLLPLPPVMLGEGPAPTEEVVLALETTGYFLSEKLAPDLGTRPIPDARARLINLLSRIV